MGDRVSGHGFQDTRVSGGTTGYACTGVAFPLSGAQFFVQSGPKGDNERRRVRAVAIVHRRRRSGLGLGSDVCQSATGRG